MEIIYSRHAKRRTKLYGIPEDAITNILRKMKLSSGDHEIIKHIPGFQHPLKIVVTVDVNLMTVVTNYPLKKGCQNENTL
jgi:hypothetical protein